LLITIFTYLPIKLIDETVFLIGEKNLVAETFALKTEIKQKS